MMPRRVVAPLAAVLLPFASGARAGPTQDLERAYVDLQHGSYPAAHAEAQRYLAANGPNFTAAFIAAMAECMLHPHLPSNGAPFRQLDVDYVISGPKRLDVNRAIRQCTSPKPPPPPPEAGVSVAALSERPDFSAARPAADAPPPRRPRPPVIPPTAIVARPAVIAQPSVVAPPAVAAVPLVVANPAARCSQGYVWREAFPGDHVCVTPQVRADAADDNARAGERRDPGGAYGPLTCLQGYVWRGARDGDAVCVVPARRDQATADNAAAASRLAKP